uniref:Uncharacterized protein n=1 Tax=Arundo donax TaxID=35708 RepID=A0A0A9DMM7_ARUDO
MAFHEPTCFLSILLNSNQASSMSKVLQYIRTNDASMIWSRTNPNFTAKP